MGGKRYWDGEKSFIIEFSGSTVLHLNCPISPQYNLLGFNIDKGWSIVRYNLLGLKEELKNIRQSEF